MIKNLKCEICCIEFSGYHNRKYCDDCQKDNFRVISINWKIKNGITRQYVKCVICDKILTGHHIKYCSKKCYSEILRRRRNKGKYMPVPDEDTLLNNLDNDDWCIKTICEIFRGF